MDRMPGPLWRSLQGSTGGLAGSEEVSGRSGRGGLSACHAGRHKLCRRKPKWKTPISRPGTGRDHVRSRHAAPGKGLPA